jgi:hypothetical protein
VVKYTCKGLWYLITSGFKKIKRNKKQRKINKEVARITANPPSYKELYDTTQSNIREINSRLSLLKGQVGVQGNSAKETREKRKRIREKIDKLELQLVEEKLYAKQYLKKMNE